jgi:hypothetical protein
VSIKIVQNSQLKPIQEDFFGKRLVVKSSASRGIEGEFVFVGLSTGIGILAVGSSAVKKNW